MPRVRIDINLANNGWFELTGAGNDSLEIVHLEPEQDAVADWLIRVPERTMVVIGVPIVELEHQSVSAPLARVVARVTQSLVLAPTMTADAAEQLLIPAARSLNVSTKDEWLSAHPKSVA